MKARVTLTVDRQALFDAMFPVQENLHGLASDLTPVLLTGKPPGFLDALRLALWGITVDEPAADQVEAVAFAMWKEEAAEGTPKSVQEGRTLEAFRDALPAVRERWERFARAALRAQEAPTPSPAAKGGEAEALTEAMAFIKRYARHDGSCLTGREGDYGERTCECDFNSKRVRLRAKIAALATPSPQPADAVREALRPFAQIADEYDDKEDDRHEVWIDCGPNRVIRTRLTLGKCRAARAALASDPAPAGEVVEVPPACDWPGCIGEGRQCVCDERADERLARLRADLERVTRELEEEAALRVDAIDRMKAAERERDDARKALETIKSAGRGLYNCCYNLSQMQGASISGRDAVSMREAYQAWDAATRSASREGASDE